jgi:hypothetical protein
MCAGLEGEPLATALSGIMPLDETPAAAAAAAAAEEDSGSARDQKVGWWLWLLQAAESVKSTITCLRIYDKI